MTETNPMLNRPVSGEELSDAELAQIMQRLDRYAKLYDNQFRIPFTRIRIGLDAIIGVIPVIGETIGLLLSLYLLQEAIRLKVPRSLIVRMIANVILDWLIGLVPLLGDIADIAFKANIRNFQLLQSHLEQELRKRQSTEDSSYGNVFLYLSVSLIFIAISYYLVAALNLW